MIDATVGVAGACHDARIWANSNIRRTIDQGRILNGDAIDGIPQVSFSLRVFVAVFVSVRQGLCAYLRCRPCLQMIIGDSASPNTTRTIAVAKESGADNQERAAKKRRYNLVVSSGRILVEQCIGSIKMRWPMFLDKMRTRRHNTVRLFLAACVLHNFWLAAGQPLLSLEEIEARALQDVNGDGPGNQIDMEEQVE